MDEVGRILLAVEVVVARQLVLCVLRELDTAYTFVTPRAAVLIQEVGIVGVSLELADETVVFVDAAFVGRRFRALVAAGPLAEHTRGVAVLLHDFGQDDVVRVIGFLADEIIVLADAVLDHGTVPPVFLVTADVCMS